jgi:hypothetical protein
MSGMKIQPTWRCLPTRYTANIRSLCGAGLTCKTMQGARLREKQNDDTVDYDDDDSSDDEEIEEELGYISPLDNVDPYVSFKRALTGAHDTSVFPLPCPNTLL